MLNPITKLCSTLSFTLLLGLLASCNNATAPSTDSFEVVTKSPNDPREYRHLTLDNGMRVLLISDAMADKSAAALVAFRGNFHDPADRPGLAHFLEHMLFIGTEKYPEPDGYFSFVQKHGGSSNAYTSIDHTNYFFDVQPEYFPEALDRFAHFFIAPLLDQTYVDREKNAVHSEYKMQIKDDGWRGFMVQKVAINPEHPLSKFNIGTLETLDGDIYAALIEFFETHYSANQMGAVILHKEPLETLEPWVTELFNQVPNRNLASLNLTTPLQTPEQLPATLYHQNLKNDRSVSFSFPIPSIDPHYQSKPTAYISSLVGHEGEGSLHQLLSQKGWITALGAGSDNIDQANAAFDINIDLTEAGYANVPAITDLVFDYIGLLQSGKPEAFLYNEAATVAKLGFEFREQIPSIATVQSLAPNLMKYPAADLLVAPYLLERFDPKLIADYLAYLTPDNVLVTVAGPDIKGDAIEPWFEVPYALSPGIDRDAQSADGLALPLPNPFMPEDLDLVATPSGMPAAQATPEGIRLYLATDTAFNVPRAVMHFSVRNPSGLISAADRVRGLLYSNLVEDNLTALSYPALLAGVSYGISAPPKGFRVSLGGYHDKQLTLLDTVLDRLTTLPIDKDRFQVMKTQLKQNIENSLKDRPYQQALSSLQDTLVSSAWPAADLLAALETVTPDNLTEWRNDYFTTVSVEALLVGNVEQAAATAVTKSLVGTLKTQAFEPSRPTVRSVETPIIKTLPVDHNDAAMVLYLQNDTATLKETAKSELLGHIIAPQYFSSLRTDQQLGYVVNGAASGFEERSGLRFIIQSPSATAETLYEKTIEFLKAQAPRLADMSPEDYAENQEGLIAQLLERDKNLGSRAWRYWVDLDDQYLNFDRRQQLADAIAATDQKTLRAYLDALLIKTEQQYLLIQSLGKLAAASDA
jgi:secreted Zn-dependent insulinase-like peptidase